MTEKLKILVEMKHGLGDCICAIPMLKVLRNNYPDSYIALVVNNHVNEELFRLSDIKINKFYYLSLKNRTLKDTIKLIFELRNEKFDYGILATMTPKLKGKIFLSLLGIKNKIGEQYKNLSFFDLDDKKHFVERNLDLLKDICDLPMSKIYPKIYEDKDFCNTIKVKYEIILKKQKIIGICVGNGDISLYKGKKYFTRGWGIRNIKKLIELLLHHEYTVFLFGGIQEKVLLGPLETVLNNKNVINFVGETTITESATLVYLCDLVIGVDTGMQHIAAAIGTPTLSIFGPTNPKTHGAYAVNASFIENPISCQYCFTNENYYICEERKCLKGIMPEDVYSRAINILGKD